ncbi:MAG: GNAT family N-acetyltransferase [Anaerolineales bacterium]|nr:GNAT family N-acetyltransferase [Anaerolineales bacterium]
MQITFIHDDEDFQSMAELWNDLLLRSTTNVPFLRHEYLSAWWSTLGGGEWEAGYLWIGIGRNDQGTVIGIAPFFLADLPDGRRVVRFLGTLEISDYLDLIVPRESCSAFVDALFEALEGEGPERWGVLDLYNIPEASPTQSALEKAARKQGWKFVRERLQPCPVIGLDRSWDDYLSGLDKKQRHELRRKIRRVERHSPEIRWRVVGTGDDIETETEKFLALMATDPHKEGFLTDAMRKQFHRSAKAAHEWGWLHLSFLEMGNDLVAGYFNFDYLDRLWIYNSGMNPDYLHLSPGWVLLGYLIKWAAESGKEAIDFMRGDESYKYRLGGVDTSIFRFVIER